LEAALERQVYVLGKPNFPSFFSIYFHVMVITILLFFSLSFNETANAV